ncbi:sigma-54 dependent transcriptional regulator [Hyphomicrobiales bacterium 4NK60-0047b]|jgi:two-component system response regulator FlrC
MRLTIIGSLSGNLSTATKIAMQSGAKVTHAQTIETALNELRNGQGADLIMIEDSFDIRELVERLETEHIHISVVACGSGENTRAAVEAIQAGAKEYIPLPPDPELIAAILTAVSRDQKAMIYRDPIMTKVIAMADQVANSEASILITGESGTGKEVMARHVHEQSARANKIFISVNCAAIPENLLESELFGHEKGAFTGALHRRIGKFEEANGGTLLLDEISEMDVRLQAKLLRALQERIIDRVGGNKPVPVDIRIIATSNRNLAEAVQEGTFREDLLYRLNVVNLTIPPLRDRKEDVIALASHFVEKYTQANGFESKTLSEDALNALLQNEWQGNVRELENTIHRAVLLSNGSEINPDVIRPPEALTNLANEPAAAAAATAEAVQQNLVGMTVAEVERDLILNTLDHCIGNRTHAANILGISIRTLRNKLKQYGDEGLEIPQPNETRTIAT